MSAPMPNRRLILRSVLFAAVTALVGSYYLWCARIGGVRFVWGYDLGGYYNYLARSFQSGQLHLPLEPSRELLALSDPWDPAQNGPYKMHDVVLFNKRYYLYHGAGPVVLLFLPWRLVTGHDVPENFAVFLFSFAGFLLFAGALVRILSLTNSLPGLSWLAVLLLAMALCGGIPYLLNRAEVYESAISAGYFCVAAGVFALFQSTGSRRTAIWLVVSGLFLGAAIACRPHLGLVLTAVLLGLLISRESLKNVSSFAIPGILAGCMVGMYNFARFGNPLEFGIQYLLAATVEEQHLHIDFHQLLLGIYFLLLCAPVFGAAFPWVRQAWRYPWDSPDWPFPQGYFIEPTVGALYLAPFALAAVLIPRRKHFHSPAAKRVHTVLWSLLAAALCVMLFVSSIALSTQRYQVDFLPLLVFLALVNCTLYLSRTGGLKKFVAGVLVLTAIAFGAVVNLALGIAGPYDGYLRSNPASYARLAAWFSPASRFRPLFNPEVHVDMKVRFGSRDEGFREPLLLLGGLNHHQFLFVEHLPGKLRFLSRADTSDLHADVNHPGDSDVRVDARYLPELQRFRVSLNDAVILDRTVKHLILAPNQVVIGRNTIDLGTTHPEFTGNIDTRAAVVRPARMK